MKQIIIAFTCLVAGSITGYIVKDCPDGNTPGEPCLTSECCDRYREYLKNCLDTPPPPSSITNVTDVNILRQAYGNYLAMHPADSSGYSLDRDLIIYLNNVITNDPNIRGYRLYPGNEDNLKKTIFISLVQNTATDTFLTETINHPKGFQYYSAGLKGYTGPCPDWCDNGSRIIR